VEGAEGNKVEEDADKEADEKDEEQEGGVGWSVGTGRGDERVPTGAPGIPPTSKMPGMDLFTL